MNRSAWLVVVACVIGGCATEPAPSDDRPKVAASAASATPSTPAPPVAPARASDLPVAGSMVVTASITPPGAQDVAMSPDGAWVYALVRGADSEHAGVVRYAVGAGGTAPAAPQRVAVVPGRGLGIAVLNAATTRFPVGTVWVMTPGGLIAFDATGGQELGRIPLGSGSLIAKTIDHPVLQPTGMVFDKDGRLLIADAGGIGAAATSGQSRPGIVRLLNEALDDFVANRLYSGGCEKCGTAGSGVDFQSVPARPVCINYSADEDAIFYGTATRGVGRIRSFELGRFEAPEPLIQSDTPLRGIAVTPRETILLSDDIGTVRAYLPKWGAKRVVEPAAKRLTLSNGAATHPAKLQTVTMPGGVERVLIFEPGTGVVRIATLPAGL